MKTYRRLALILCIGIFFANTVQSQWIIDLSIYPPNPTSMDDIILVSENMFPSGDCWLDSSSMVVNGFDIHVETYFTTGALAVICTSYDTFQLGQLPDGNYQLHYNLQHPSANPQIEDSTTISFTVGSVGISEENINNKISVFPNPTKGTIILSIPEVCIDEELIFRVLSIDGKEVKRIKLKATTSTLPIDLSELPSGYYLYDCHLIRSQLHNSGKLEIFKP